MNKHLSGILFDDENNMAFFDEIIMEEKVNCSSQINPSLCETEIEEYNQSTVNSGRTNLSEGLIEYAVSATFNSDLFRKRGNPDKRGLVEQITKESFVLLKNDNLLPLSKTNVKRIAIIGPYADDSKLFNGFTTILKEFQNEYDKSEIIYAQGCVIADYSMEEKVLLSEAVWAAEQAEAVILAVGSSNSTNIFSDHAQTELIDAVCNIGKPTVLLNFTDLAADLSKADELCGAVLQCWHPTEFSGLTAVRIIFGDYQPAGKLPVTFYKEIKISEEKKLGRRNYNYYKGIPLYPFGYGLSYSKIEYYRIYLSSPKITAGDDITVTVFLKNKGRYAATDIVQVYIHDEVSKNKIPVRRLCAYKKVKLPADMEIKVSLTVKSEYMEIVGKNGKSIIEPGRFSLYVGGGQPDDVTASLYKRDCLHIGFLVE